MLPVYRLIVEFGGCYLLLGICTAVVAALLLRRRDAHDAIQALVLFVCTIVVGTRVVWTVWVAAQPYPLTVDGIAQANAVSLKVAWAFMALAGHFLITGAGHFCRRWERASHRMAALLSVFTMCVGLLGAWQCYLRWQTWFTPELDQVAANWRENLKLTDQVTAQMALETPDDWSILLVRGHYLSDVGRFREAYQALTQALNHVPEDEKAIHQGIAGEIKRLHPPVP